MSDPEEQLDYGESDNSQDRLSFSAGSAGMPSEPSQGQATDPKNQPGEEVTTLFLQTPLSEVPLQLRDSFECRCAAGYRLHAGEPDQAKDNLLLKDCVLPIFQVVVCVLSMRLATG